MGHPLFIKTIKQALSDLCQKQTNKRSQTKDHQNAHLLHSQYLYDRLLLSYKNWAIFIVYSSVEIQVFLLQ